MPAVKQKLNTPAMQSHKTASDAYAKAKEAMEKNETAATKKAFEDAREKLKTATIALNTERFKRVGNKRINKAVAAINFMGDTFNPRSYTFTKEQGEAAIAHMKEAIKSAEAKLQRALSGGGGAAKSASIEL